MPGRVMAPVPGLGLANAEQRGCYVGTGNAHAQSGQQPAAALPMGIGNV
jgi:hypothetical protein